LSRFEALIASPAPLPMSTSRSICPSVKPIFTGFLYVKRGRLKAVGQVEEKEFGIWDKLITSFILP